MTDAGRDTSNRTGAFDHLMGSRRTLRWRILVVLLSAAMLPLGLAAAASWVMFSRLLEEKSLEQMRAMVDSHAREIEAHLAERIHLLRLAVHSHTADELVREGNLTLLLAELNRLTRDGFVDLGVIDADGDHLAYVGPFDLRGQDYRDAEWFREVTASGVYISDVFEGVRRVPHCIIAVRTERPGPQWILRGTINSAWFDDLVKTLTPGAYVDAFIVDREGRYQTTPPHGKLLDRAEDVALEPFAGVANRRLRNDRATLIQVTTWLNSQRWLLVVQQPLATVRAPVHRAIADIGLIVAVGGILLVVTTFVATRYLTSRIEQATAGREEMSRAFVRSAKLASIGELATGLAHEINNPLAIMSAEQTNITDLLEEGVEEPNWRADARESAERSKAQIQRCASITQKMLQFGRQRESAPEPTAVTAPLADIADLLRRHAAVHNVNLRLEIEPNLPKVVLDPVELEQVLVNLINNAIDAMPDGGEIVVSARRAGQQLQLAVSDTGVGMPPEVEESIFEPFFTTKPVGQGTGLGLSVCYGIVTGWGGTIRCQSQPGKGTTMLMTAPLLPAVASPRETRSEV